MEYNACALESQNIPRASEGGAAQCVLVRKDRAGDAVKCMKETGPYITCFFLYKIIIYNII